MIQMSIQPKNLPIDEMKWENPFQKDYEISWKDEMIYQIKKNIEKINWNLKTYIILFLFTFFIFLFVLQFVRNQ